MDLVQNASFVCDYRPLKDEKWRIRLVVGGDRLSYNSDVGSPATDIMETKILFNSTISDAKNGARFATIDLKDMFLHTLMADPEYMRVPYKYFPQDIRTKYNSRLYRKHTPLRLIGRDATSSDFSLLCRKQEAEWLVIFVYLIRKQKRIEIYTMVHC